MPLNDELSAIVKGLEDKLVERYRPIRELHAYYRGNHRLCFATAKYQKEFGYLVRFLSDNWCQLVVDAATERLQIEGFRFGPDSDSDKKAWALWQKNDLDADSNLAHTEAGICGISYLLVTPDDNDTPRITIESPYEAITMTAAGNRRKRIAGLKRWNEADKSISAVFYTPDTFYRLTKSENAPQYTLVDEITNQTGTIPLVPMLNNPQLHGGGMSDLRAVIPLQDAINKLLADMVINSEFQAYRQRWATGIEIPRDPETGEPLDREAFLSSMSRLWVAEDPNVKFGELAGSDGAGYINNIESLIQHIAAQTRTPPHYLLGQSGSFPSGESLKATETGLVAKVRRKQVTFGEAWEEAMRIAFAFQNDKKRASAYDAEVIWADPESKSEGELVDSLLKMSQLDVPNEALWERWGASPQEIERWQAELAAAPEPPEPTEPEQPVSENPAVPGEPVPYQGGPA